MADKERPDYGEMARLAFEEMARKLVINARRNRTNLVIWENGAVKILRPKDLPKLKDLPKPPKKPKAGKRKKKDV